MIVIRTLGEHENATKSLSVVAVDFQWHGGFIDFFE